MYFKECKTEAELKARFKELAAVHHPAKGGFIKVWEMVNTEYQEALKLVNSVKEPEQQTKQNKSPEQPKKVFVTNPDELLKKAAYISKFKGVKVVISGSWIWATGATKEISSELKKEGFIYPRKKDDLSAWFYREPENKCFKRRGKQGLPLGQIQIKYGAQEV